MYHTYFLKCPSIRWVTYLMPLFVKEKKSLEHMRVLWPFMCSSHMRQRKPRRKVPSRLDEGKSVFVFVAVCSGWDSNKAWWSYCFRVCRVKSKVTCGFRTNFGGRRKWGGVEARKDRKRSLCNDMQSRCLIWQSWLWRCCREEGVCACI